MSPLLTSSAVGVKSCWISFLSTLFSQYRPKNSSVAVTCSTLMMAKFTSLYNLRGTGSWKHYIIIVRVKISVMLPYLLIVSIEVMILSDSSTFTNSSVKSLKVLTWHIIAVLLMIVTSLQPSHWLTLCNFFIFLIFRADFIGNFLWKQARWGFSTLSKSSFPVPNICQNGGLCLLTAKIVTQSYLKEEKIMSWKNWPLKKLK